MTTGKKALVLILALVLVIGGTYLYRAQKSNTITAPIVTQPTPTPTPFQLTKESDEQLVKNLVNDFYTALEARDGKLLFSLMTPPESATEKADFKWLTGADLVGEAPLYRVFFRQNINILNVDEVLMMEGGNTYTVKASDNLTGTPSAGGEDKIYKPIPRKTVLTVIKSGDTWLIDKFTNPTNTKAANTSSLKYSGFEQ